jgi:hypothetical protein
MFLDHGHPVDSVASEVRLRIYLFEVTMFSPPDTVEFENNRRQWASLRIFPKAFNPGANDLQVIADRLRFVPTPAPGVPAGKFEIDEP